MSYKVTVNGVPVTCTDPQEVLDLVRHINSDATPPAPRPGRPAVNGVPAKEKKAAAEKKAAIAFLEAIAKDAQQGVRSQAICAAMNLKAAQGVGVASALVRRVLERHQFKPDDVFLIERRRTGKFWKGRHRLSDAITKLKEDEPDGHLHGGAK